MTSQTITNEVLYEFLKDYKNEVYQRFEQLEKRADQADKRSDHIEARLYRIEYLGRENQKILGELWQTREKVTVNFSKIIQDQ